MTDRPNIADILCVGCQKGSTSWLHSVLACHPGTHSFPDSDPVTSTDKEAHFWDWNRHRGVDWYRTLLTPPNNALQAMDFTPEYAFLPPDQIAECQAVNPTARVIYILRDPLARAVSAIRMHLLWAHGAGWDGVLDLGPDLYRWVAEARLDRHGDYAGNAARWRAAYPDLIVVNYEDFHTDRPARVAALMAELRLDPAAMDGAARARFDGLMGARIWASEPFALTPRARHFLHGLTRQARLDGERALGLRWFEGARLLDGA